MSAREAPAVRAGLDVRRLATWSLTLAVVVVLYALAPLYSGTFFLSFMVDVVILGLAALGLQHQVGDAGVLNLGQAAFFGLGAYGGVWVLQHWHWTTLGAFAGAIVVALAGAVVMAPLLRLRGVYFAMASFAFGAMMFEVFGQAVGLTGGENGLYLIPPPKLLGHQLLGNRDSYLFVLTVALLCYGLLPLAARQGYGLAQHAVPKSFEGDVLTLALKPEHAIFSNDALIRQLQDKLGAAIGHKLRERVVPEAAGVRPALDAARVRSDRHAAAAQALADDPIVQEMQRQLGAEIIPESIRPAGEQR